jgi:hypothetical protein
METSCPDCGGAAELVARPSRVLQGTCAGCGRSFTMLQDASADGPGGSMAGSATTPGEPGSTLASSAAGSAVPPVGGPECASCGAPLTLRSSSESTLEANCASCGSTFRYELAQRPFRSRSGPREDRPRSDARGGFGPQRTARPCRECGAPLRFSTTADGMVTGECTSCGNRFTLPPRREFGGGREDRDRRPRTGRSFPSGDRGGNPRWRPRGAGGPRPSYRGAPSRFRRTERRGDDEDDDGERRRRRPRRE